MKTYWDFSEKQRSEMSKEDVTGLLDMELMVKGVKKVDAPILKPLNSVKIATEIWYEVEGVFFKSAELAQQFLALDPRKSTYDYACGYDYHYACEMQVKIVQTTLYSRQELLNLASILKENKCSKEYNEKVTEEYSKKVKEVDRVLNGVWEDWYSCQDKAAIHKAVIDTKEEYMKLTEQNVELADTFLKKMYSETEIKDAIEWFAT